MASHPLPRIGDIVHYVSAPGQHVPAFVMRDGAVPHDTLTLFISLDVDVSRPVEHTHGGDSFVCPILWGRRVPYAGPARDTFGIWHWPEHRTKPTVPSPEEEPI